jgi:GT2 family glycosyltransferase
MTDTCVILATSNRPQIVGGTLDALRKQTVAPGCIILSCVQPSDVAATALGTNASIVTGERGLTRQRNNGLRHVPDSISYVAFFDDDFVPEARWIEAVEGLFRAHPDIVVITGNVIADGINNAGFTFEQAAAFIAAFDKRDTDWIKDDYSPYGCNMAFRRSALQDTWFDERLVLYGWQEDRDFGARVARRGRTVQAGAAMGVHLGVKGGRVSGVRLGYSQVVNPVYLRGKGTVTLATAAQHIAKNMISNVVKSIRPEDYVDRRGRLRGNLMGVFDVLRGRIRPERAAEL